MHTETKTPRYTIHVNDTDQYELVDTLYEVILETFQFATDAESACFLKNFSK